MPLAALALLAASIAAGGDPAPAAAGAPLTKAQAESAVAATLKAVAERSRTARGKELKSGVLEIDGARMPVWMALYKDGKRVEDGKRVQAPSPSARAKLRPIWISRHGGGGAPAPVNDQQGENQKRLYQPPEGIYVAPRAPSNEWNLWHQAPVDRLFARLIEDLVITQQGDPDRVYLMGYSAGGDGVYQLAPRMADRFAAASMMAGHPNEARPDGLRNLPFAIHMGALDGAYDRNTIAAKWGAMLDALAQADPGAYVHVTDIHAGKGHWMDREDAKAVPWMAGFTRDPRPRKVVWLQDDVTHPRLYWVENPDPKQGQRVVVEREGQEIRVLEAPAGIALRFLLDDSMLDLDADVRVTQSGQELFKGRVPRTRTTVERVIAGRYDPRAAFTAEVQVTTRSSAGS
ncbi:MAG: alpha/beta hydrolase [Planctomycetota bacterium]